MNVFLIAFAVALGCQRTLGREKGVIAKVCYVHALRICMYKVLY